MILEYRYINAYDYLGDMEASWEDGNIVPTVVDDFDRIAWEKLLHSIPQEQTEVLICKYLGFKPKEIVKILHYKNIGKYYNANYKLRDMYRKRKNHYIDYN